MKRREVTAGFLTRALRYFAARGIRVARVMTDNGSAYRSHVFAAVLADHQMRHLRTRPYTPRTNGKAERFIRTLLAEWAYAQSYPYQRRAHRQTHALSWLLQHGPTPHGDPRPDARAEARDTVNNVLINNS